MRWIIIFMHSTEPAVRIVEGTESEATVLLMRVRHIYEDAEARMIPLTEINHNDLIEADYYATAPD